MTRNEEQNWVDVLRALADHLEQRTGAPSLDGYELVEGLRAAAALLARHARHDGPMVHVDAAGAQMVPLRMLIASIA